MDYSIFQDEFDLDVGKDFSKEKPSNNFKSVAKTIQQKYNHIIFGYDRFDKGAGNDKLKVIEKLLANSQFVLVSLALEPFGGIGWHIMPIVEHDKDSLTLIKIVDKDGNPNPKLCGNRARTKYVSIPP